MKKKQTKTKIQTKPKQQPNK